MKRAIGVLLLIFVAGCQTDTPGMGEAFMSKDQRVAKDDTICRGYGFRPGTRDFQMCMMKQGEIRANTRGRAAAALLMDDEF